MAARNKKFTVYLGQAEQFAYTFHARGLEDLKSQIRGQWPYSYTGRWFKVKDVDGLPTGAKRFIVRDKAMKSPVLIIPERKPHAY